MRPLNEVIVILQFLRILWSVRDADKVPSNITALLNFCSISLFLPPPYFMWLQVIQFALRDYIQYWYYTLSEDESFLLEIRQTLQNALVQFSTRYKTHRRTCIFCLDIEGLLYFFFKVLVFSYLRVCVCLCAKVQRGGLAALLHHSPGGRLCHPFTCL